MASFKGVTKICQECGKEFRVPQCRQSGVQRIVQMFIGQIKGRLKKLNCTVKSVVSFFMTIRATENEESSVHTSVLMNRMLRLKTVSVHFVEIFLKPIHLLLICVVRGNVVLRGQKVKTGRHGRSFWNSASIAVRNFGLSRLKKYTCEANIVLVTVPSIRERWTLLRHRVSTALGSGCKSAKRFLTAITTPVKNVGLMVRVCMSTIRNINEMVEMKKIKIFSHYAQGAIMRNIGIEFSDNINYFSIELVER